MHIGTQHITGDTWAAYQVLTQLGVNHVSANPPGPWQNWDVDVLTQFREKLSPTANPMRARERRKVM